MTKGVVRHDDIENGVKQLVKDTIRTRGTSVPGTNKVENCFVSFLFGPWCMSRITY